MGRMSNKSLADPAISGESGAGTKCWSTGSSPLAVALISGDLNKSLVGGR